MGSNHEEPDNRTNPVDAQVAVDAKARIVGLLALRHMSSWHMMAVLARHWTAIENQTVANSGPWWLSASWTGTRSLDYRMR